MSDDLKAYISATTPMFDEPDTASREAFQATAAILSRGDQAAHNLAGYATYLGWTAEQVRALAEPASAWRSSPPPLLRKLIAAGMEQQSTAYAVFLVQVTRIACVQFAPRDSGAARAASEIAASITRFTPVSNTALEPPAATPTEPSATQTVGEALDELERLVGLESAKREINQQVQLLRIAAMRQAAGLKNPSVSRHLVFLGNPGTGKTTVARIVGRIYRALAVVPDGHLVETDASGLIAGYVGQTAIKTSEQITKALGGILFIDEAYGLTRNEFGLEAIDTLVKAMEDNRESLVVIVAGYTQEMRDFLASNPGLESRFPTTITFDDYTPQELLAILSRIAADSDYRIETPDDPVLAAWVTQAAQREGFGNAREMRNAFEAAVRRHAWRLRDTADVTVDQMKTLTTADLVEVASG
ncbi:MAG: AAA family ATPase [Candidatus Nanopelagicales bacterium]|nr:AAA family ATPase [Candidatus Nanopelagicales bacterium]